MAIELIGKIKPKNNGSFAMVDAADVEMPDGTRLSEAALGGGADPRVDALIETVGAVFDENGKVKEEYLPDISGGSKVATHVDLTRYASEGVIVEHYADGTTLTHTMEFDGSGNPIKITDSDGKEVTLTW